MTPRGGADRPDLAGAPPGGRHTRILRERGDDHLVVDRLHLAVVEGPDAGSNLEVSGSSVVIGKEARDGLILRDSAVSRMHCELTVGEGPPTVRDLGSRNGTVL